MAYTKVHRFFLRTIMNENVMKRNEADRLLSTFDEVEVSLNEFITEINLKIKPLLQEIKIVKNDVNGDEEIVFLSLADDEITKSQTHFSPSEMEYCRIILEEILTSETKSVSSTIALNSTSKVKIDSITKAHAQDLLGQWCDLRYLQKDSHGYKLDTRGIHEFDQYFNQNYASCIDNCFLCEKPVFTSVLCTSCNESYHSHCRNKYMATAQTCPKCMSAFEIKDNNSVQAQPSDGEDSDLSQIQTKRRRITKPKS